jgi:hypothetical protein
VPTERKLMDKRIKNRWIKALTSGKYKQGQTELRNVNETYCCLGVLLCVLDNKGWTLRKSDPYSFFPSDRGPKWHHKRQMKDNVLLSLNLLKELKISEDDQQQLANMNDNRVSFKKIAKWIGKNL